MKKTARLFASLLGALLTLFPGSRALARMRALYMGPPPSLQGKVLDSTSSNAIAGLRVELLKHGRLLAARTTAGDGSFYFPVERKDTGGPWTIRISDVDGAANGSYQGSTNTLPNAFARPQFFLKRKK